MAHFPLPRRVVRRFASAGRDYLIASAPCITAYPFTVACWFRAATQHAGSLWTVADTESNTEEWSLQVQLGGGVRCSTRAGTAVEANATTSTTYSVGVWHHALFLGRSSTDRRVYLNNGGEATNSTDKSPTGLSVTAVGRTNRITPAFYFNGRLAQLAVWAIDLPPEDRRALVDGAQPSTLHPEALVAYWPFYDSTVDYAADVARARAFPLLQGAGSTASPDEDAGLYTRLILPRVTRRVRVSAHVVPGQTLTCSPAQALWHVPAPLISRTLACQPASAQWQAPAGIMARTIVVTPTRAQWQASTPLLMQTLVAVPAEAQWQAVIPLTARTLLVLPGQAQWQAPGAGITGGGQLLVQGAPARAAWQAAAGSVLVGLPPHTRLAPAVVVGIETQAPAVVVGIKTL